MPAAAGAGDERPSAFGRISKASCWLLFAGSVSLLALTSAVPVKVPACGAR